MIKESGKIRADLISLADEKYSSDKPLMIFDAIATWKKTLLEAGSYTVRELLVPVFVHGECVYESPSVMEIRDYCAKRAGDTLGRITPLCQSAGGLCGFIRAIVEIEAGFAGRCA